MYDTPPVLTDVSPDAQTRYNDFHAYLHTPDRFFDCVSDDVIVKAMCDIELNGYNLDLFEDRFSEVLGNFCKTIWIKGLYAIVNVSRHARLELEVEGVSIRTLTSAGRVLITISLGEEKTSGFRHITFIAAEDDPTNMGIHTHLGTINEMLDMVSIASKPFIAIFETQTIMAPITG